MKTGGSVGKKTLSAKCETWVQSLGREDPLEKEMAIYSSIPAWEIPWTEEPGKIQCMRSQELDSLVTKPPPEMVGVSPVACLF